MPSQSIAARPLRHLIFLALFVFMVINRYLLISVLSPELSDSAWGRVLGASAGYVLIWGVAYWLCLRSPDNNLLLLLGGAALPVSLYSAPLAGYLLLALMAVIGRPLRAKRTVASDGTKYKMPSPWPLRISPFRILSILFWSLLLFYFFSHSRVIAVVLVIVLVLLVWSRLNPLSARIFWVKLTAPFSGDGRRGFTEMVAREPQIAKANVPQLVQLLNSPNFFVRGKVHNELVKRGDPSSVPLLMEKLPKTNPAALASHLSCAGQLARPSQAPLLIPFVDHAFKKVRRVIARDLGRLANPIATQPLASAFAAEIDPAAQAQQFKALLQLAAVEALTPLWSTLPVADRKRLLRALLDPETDINSIWAPVQQLIAEERSAGVKAVFAHLHTEKIWADTRQQFPALDTSEKAPKHLAEQASSFKAPLPDALWPQLQEQIPELVPTRNPLEIQLQLRFAHRSTNTDDSSDVIRAELGVALPQGQAVTVSAYFSTEDLFEAAADRGHAPLHFLPTAPATWRQAYAAPRLADNLYYFDDGRDNMALVIGDKTQPIRRKYFACRMDLALAATDAEKGPALLVCLKGVFESKDYTELPPFLVRMDLMAFLCARREIDPWDEISEEKGPLRSPQVTT